MHLLFNNYLFCCYKYSFFKSANKFSEVSISNNLTKKLIDTSIVVFLKFLKFWI